MHDRHRRLEPRPQLADVTRMEQRELAAALVCRQHTQTRDERIQLGDVECGRRERLQVLVPILEVSLDAHRAEDEPAESKLRSGARQVIADDSHRARVRGRGDLTIPVDRRRRTGGIAHREADALVRRVRPEVDDAPFVATKVDLNGVALGVVIKACAIAFVGRSVVQPRIGQREYGQLVPRGRDSLRACWIRNRRPEEEGSDDSGYAFRASLHVKGERRWTQIAQMERRWKSRGVFEKTSFASLGMTEGLGRNHCLTLRISSLSSFRATAISVAPLGPRNIAMCRTWPSMTSLVSAIPAVAKLPWPSPRSSNP